MKVLIDISEEDYLGIKDPDRLTAYWANIRAKEAIRKGTPIPDNAKNIDVLMTVFPKADIRFEGRNNELFGYIEFAGDWLEAPYKTDKEKEE